MNSETPQKGHVNTIKEYFSPRPTETPHKKTKPVNKRSPSPSPYKDPPQNTGIKPSTRQKVKRKRSTEDPTDTNMPPKVTKMGSKDTPSDEISPNEPTTTLDDIKKLLLSQETKFQQNFKNSDDHIKTSIAQLKIDLQKVTDPLIEKQKQTDKEVESLKIQIDENRKETHENKKLLEKVFESTQEQIKTQHDLNNTLLEIQVKQAQNFPDPQTSQQRQRLYEDLQRENCVLTIQNCTETLDGKPGWTNLLTKCKFRNNFSHENFPSGVLQTRLLSGGRSSTTVTFLTKKERDLFYRNVDKKDQNMKFYESYPIQYRSANKALRQKANMLREIDLITDITVDENDLIMYLRYKNKNNGSKTQYDYQIHAKFDPFDKEDEYSTSTQTSTALNKTSLLIKPQYGSVFTKESLTEELTTLITYIQQSDLADSPSQFPTHTPTIISKHIILQFENPQDTLKAQELFEQNKGKFLKGAYTDAIL